MLNPQFQIVALDYIGLDPLLSIGLFVSTQVLEASRQAAQAAIGGCHQTNHLRGRAVFFAQTNLNLAVGTPERDDPPARDATASKDVLLCQVPDGPRDADAAFQSYYSLFRRQGTLKGKTPHKLLD